MISSENGTLSGSSITGTPELERNWSLDAAGNWSTFITKTSGTTDLDQDRTNNAVNEITNITETTGPSWASPAYDAAGNMITIPQPDSLTNSYSATYDAWNRLVKLVDGANTVVEYEYDGRNQRIVSSIYASGTLDHHQHTYYNINWQALEIRKEVGGSEDSDPLEQFVWHPYYIDALLLRDYDENTDGTTDRHYFTHNTNFNVTSVADDTGNVLERYEYGPYGTRLILDSDFSDDADGISDIGNYTGFTGREHTISSGLLYYRNRFYHPLVGTFLSRDPTLYAGSRTSLYEYTSSNPISHLDPSGLIFFIDPIDNAIFLYWQSQFVHHYFYGEGATVDLRDWGLLPVLQALPSVVNATTKFQSDTMKALQLRRFKVQCLGKRSFSFTNDTFAIIDANLNPYLFSLGNSVLKMHANCRISLTCQKCPCEGNALYPKRIRFECRFTYSIKDSFKDPVDIFDLVEGETEVGGTPYDIIAHWEVLLKTSTTYRCPRSR